MSNQFSIITKKGELMMDRLDSNNNISDSELNTFWLKLPNLQWEKLISGLTPSLYKRKTILYRCNEENYFVYVIKSGRVGLYFISPNGNKKILGVAEEGSIIGELSFFQEITNSCTAEAYIDSIIYKIPFSLFKERVFSDVMLMENLYKNLAYKVKMLQTQVEYLSYKNAISKISMFILSMCKAHGEKTNGEYKIKLSFSHNDIAESTGLTRVSVTNTLLELSKLDIIEKKNGIFYVKDINKLNELIDKS